MDLLEHLRQLMLVQHLGEVPPAFPVTEETSERLLGQATQMGEATVLRLIDLLAVAVDDMRQGGDPRLPLELALVKVTRPAADLARESVAFRLERLEQGAAVPAPPASPSNTVLQGQGRRRLRATAGGAENRAVGSAGGVGAHRLAGGRGARRHPDGVGLREAHPSDLQATR